MKKKAILYSRFSSEKQNLGDSIRRQSEQGKAYASKLGLELIEVTDKGISAFKGKNNTTGNLNTLIKNAESGEIPAGTVLIVESLDRVSRQNPIDALDVFKRLLNSGLEVHTLIDNQIYTRESVHDNFFSLLGSLFVMQRAYDESLTKSIRAKASIQARKKAVIEDGAVWKGVRPHWIEVKNNKNVIIEEKAKIVAEIITRYLNGLGANKIAQQLNDEGFKSANGKNFSAGGIFKLLGRKSLYGTFEIDGKEIEDYFPALITKDQFNQIQYLRSQKNPTKPTKGRIGSGNNPFTGLIKCGVCGGAMHIRHNGGQRLQCENKLRTGCNNATIKLEEFKELFFKWYDDIDFSIVNKTQAQTKAQTIKNNIETIKGENLKIKNQIDNYMNALGFADSKDQGKIFTDKIIELQTKQKELDKEIEDLRIQLQAESNQGEIIKTDITNLTTDEINLALKEHIHNISIKSKRIEGTKDYNRVISLKWNNGKISQLNLGEDEIIWAKKDGSITEETVTAWKIAG